MAERSRSSFGPTLLIGLAGAVLASVAGARTWATASGSAAGVAVRAGVKGSESAPLVVALGLVTLAAWGVVLVLRGRVRRAVAVVGAAASVGVVAATAAAFSRAQSDAVDAVTAKGATGDVVATSLTGWYYVAALGGLAALAAFVVAVVASPGWPAMGSRYDAPAARSATQARPAAEPDLWRALDDGRDPTE
jgi:uncharacterized membrane protein (TIGR02234 family)